MESTKKRLVSWQIISKRLDNDLELNPIDKFRYLYEYFADEDSKKFREELLDALNFEDEESRTERNALIISEFMAHCKEKGVKIPDSAFESFFNA